MALRRNLKSQPLIPVHTSTNWIKTLYIMYSNFKSLLGNCIFKNMLTWRKNKNKASGRIRLILSRNVDKLKRLKIMVYSYSFSNAIRLIVFLIKGKWVNVYFNAFCFFRIWFWKGQHNPFHTKIDKSFVFKESCCFWVFSPRIWSVLWMRFSLKNLLHQFKKWRNGPEITKKLFSVLFLGWKYAKSKHTGLSLK